MNFSLIRSKQDLIMALLPAAADALKPHGPRQVKNAFIDLLIADVVKEISAGLTDRAISQKALQFSKQMAAQASASLVASWEPGDDLCPPWPIPWPGPRQFDSRELPAASWKNIRTADQVELAYTLTQLAGMTTSKEFNVQLKTLGTDIARGVANALADDFERCGTVPRKPLGGPRKARSISALERTARRGMTPLGIG